MGEHDSRAIRGRQAAAAGGVGAVGADTKAWQGSSVFTQVALLTWRTVRDYLTDPRQAVLSLAQPVILLFVVSSVFSKLGNHLPGYPPGIPFFQFLLPAVLVDNAFQTSLQTGAGMIDDLRNGVVARLRSLPILPSSLLIARSLTGLIRTALQASFLLLLAQLTHGNISRGGLAGMVTGVSLAMLLGWSLAWIFLAASTRIRRAATLTNLAIVVMTPLVFISSAYVPIADLPAGLAFFARINPITYAINAERAIFLQGDGGLAGAGVILTPVLTSLVLGAVASYVAVHVFRRPLQLSW